MISLSPARLRKYTRRIPSQRVLAFSVLALLLLPHPLNAETLKITSNPSGATVEIDGVVAGTTPYEVKLPGGYFHKTHSVFGARLEHPMILRISKDGYATKEIVMTEGPMRWVALNGTDNGDYWVLKRSF